MSVHVLGEALIDLVPMGEGHKGLPGGSPYNVAIGTARLGTKTSFIGRLSQDPNGELLMHQLANNRVDLQHLQTGPEPCPLAYVFAPTEGSDEVRYSFYMQGTAEDALDQAKIDAVDGIEHLHIGSFSVVRGPSSEIVRKLAARVKGNGTVSYDVNARPSITPDPYQVEPLVEVALRAADIVKISDADGDWLYPGKSADELAAQFMSLGASIVLYTQGGDGAWCYCPAGKFHVPAQAPNGIVDFVGAGDSFMAATLNGLDREGMLGHPEQLASIDLDTLRKIANRAALAAGMTVGRAGANPPTADDLDD